MRIRATTKLQNDKMVAARERLGLNQTQAANAAGISLQAWIHLEKLRYSRYTPATIEQHATTIAMFLGITAEEIAPRELWGSEVPSTHTLVRTIDTKHLLEVVRNHEQHYLLPEPRTELERDESREMLVDVLKELSSQEQEVINLHFGLNGGKRYTASEIARMYKISTSRVCEIEAKALRRLRYPAIANRLEHLI